MGATPDSIGTRIVAQWLETLPVTELPSAPHRYELATRIDDAVLRERKNCAKVVEASTALISYAIYCESEIDPTLHAHIEKIIEAVLLRKSP